MENLEAHNLPEANHTDLHRCVLINHFHPRFVLHSLEKDEAAKCKAARLTSGSELPSSFTLGQLPITNVIGECPTKGLPKHIQNVTPKLPAKTASLDSWVMHICAFPNNLPFGV